MTLLNLLCGCIALVSVFHGRIDHAAILVVIAGILDFLDGFVARMMNAHSELGKQLDSLADMVTFGVVPGVILFNLMLQSSYFATFESRLLFSVLKYYMFIVTLFSCLRLAKFNIDPRQTTYFIGLNTPTNTFMILALPLILRHDSFGLGSFILNPFILVGIASLSAFLLVAEIPFISLKFKSLKWNDNRPQYLLILGALLLLIAFRYAGPPLVVIFYLILSLIFPPDKKQVV